MEEFLIYFVPSGKSKQTDQDVVVTVKMYERYYLGVCLDGLRKTMKRLSG
jgi:hypothetical protein